MTPNPTRRITADDLDFGYFSCPVCQAAIPMGNRGPQPWSCPMCGSTGDANESSPFHKTVAKTYRAFTIPGKFYCNPEAGCVIDIPRGFNPPAHYACPQCGKQHQFQRGKDNTNDVYLVGPAVVLHNVHPNACRTYAVIRWHGQNPTVNHQLHQYLLNCKEAKQLRAQGVSYREIAAIQHLASHNTAKNRVHKMTRAQLRQELRRTADWVEYSGIPLPNREPQKIDLTKTDNLERLDTIGIAHLPSGRAEKPSSRPYLLATPAQRRYYRLLRRKQGLRTPTEWFANMPVWEATALIAQEKGNLLRMQADPETGEIKST